MHSDNAALVRLLIANMIGYLAADYADRHDLPLSDSIQRVMNSHLYQKLVDEDTALYCESLPWLYDHI